MDIISFILSLALEKGSDSPSASSVTYDPSTSVGLISTDVQDAIDELSTRGGLKNEIVQSLPLTGEEGICYFVPNNSSEVENIYDEYIWFDSLNDYEKIGSTKVDISNLLKSEAITEPYDDTKTYDVGDYVTYLGYLYKCKTAVTTAQSFAPAKWDKIDIFTYIKNDGADYIVNEKTYNALSTNNKTLTGAINEITGIVGSDNTPYVFRATSYHARQCNMRTLVGGTVAFNQLCKNGNFASTTGWGANNGISISATNNELTVSVDSDPSDLIRVQGNVPATIIDHIYLQKVDAKSSQANIMRMYCPADNSTPSFNITTTYSSCYAIRKATRSASAIQPFRLNTSDTKPVGSTYTLKNCNFIDLTQMFGSTIANYVYSLEQATTGSGVAYFKSLFPKDYYDYNVGQLMSVKALSHKMVGFNQWDEEWEVGSIDDTTGEISSANNTIRSKNYIRVVENTNYYVYVGTNENIRLFFYDANKQFISYLYGVKNTTITTPANAKYMRFRTFGAYGTTYKNDICINLHLDGERDGEYEAYSEHIYPLDSDLELRGIPKLDANNNLYYDGDTYESDGTVTRKYGFITFDGSDDENWSLQSINSYGIANFAIIGSNIKQNDHDSLCNMFVQQNSLISVTQDEGFLIAGSNTIYLRIKSTKADTVTAFKSWLSSNNVKIQYPLAETTTETADTFQKLQVAGYYGTEEFIDAEESAGNRDVAIPVGHNTDYFNSSILAYNIDYTDDKCDELKDYIDTQIQQNITSVLNASY